MSRSGWPFAPSPWQPCAPPETASEMFPLHGQGQGNISGQAATAAGAVAAHLAPTAAPVRSTLTRSNVLPWLLWIEGTDRVQL